MKALAVLLLSLVAVSGLPSSRSDEDDLKTLLIAMSREKMLFDDIKNDIPENRFEMLGISSRLLNNYTTKMVLSGTPGEPMSRKDQDLAFVVQELTAIHGYYAASVAGGRGIHGQQHQRAMADNVGAYMHIFERCEQCRAQFTSQRKTSSGPVAVHR